MSNLQRFEKLVVHARAKIQKGASPKEFERLCTELEVFIADSDRDKLIPGLAKAFGKMTPGEQNEIILAMI